MQTRRCALASAIVKLREIRAEFRRHRHAGNDSADQWAYLGACEERVLAARRALTLEQRGPACLPTYDQPDTGPATMPTEPALFGEMERPARGARPIEERTSTGSLFNGREHDQPGQLRIDELGGLA